MGFAPYQGASWIAKHPFFFSLVFIQMAEYRISIYGRKMSEWDQLASWIVNNELYSENVVWLIQVSFLHSDAIFHFELSSILACIILSFNNHRYSLSLGE